ncbi:OmpA family protein [Marinoscillum pacificum]|uniref:OmpA family protein n=1 Tax=Marinoscillum pacificum TaxID=392723 RepID=UPI002157412C|nr:OmpA family protein [Marinoscillum pacificum]
MISKLSTFCIHLSIGVAFLLFILPSQAQMTMDAQTPVKSVYSLKADYYNDYFDLKNAFLHYQKAIQDRPNAGYAMAEMASIYYQQNQLYTAFYWYEQAFLTGNPFTEKHYREYLFSLIRKGHSKRAYGLLEAYQAALKDIDLSEYKDTSFVTFDPLPISLSDNNQSITLWKDQLIYKNDTGNWKIVDGQNVKDFDLAGIELSKLQSISQIEGLNQFILLVQESSSNNKLYYTEGGTDRLDDLNKIKWKKFEPGVQHLVSNLQENALYFTAVNPINGMSELYRSRWSGKKWEQPVKQTLAGVSGNLSFPNFASGQTLFIGAGTYEKGYDVHAYDVKTNKARALPKPLNSQENELGVFWTSKDEGYLIRDNETGHLQVLAITQFNFAIPIEEKKERMIINVSKGGLPIYSSSGETVLIKSPEENIDFIIIPGTNYRMNVHLENHRHGPQELKSRVFNLPKGDLFTFNIRTVSLGQKHQSGWLDPNENRIEDIRLYPGDLVTFQLLPLSKTASTKTRIIYGDYEETLSATDTIDFGYVIEESFDSNEEQEEYIREPEPIQEELFAEESLASDTLIDEVITEEFIALDTADVELIATLDSVLIEDSTTQIALASDAVSDSSVIASQDAEELEPNDALLTDNTTLMADITSITDSLKSTELAKSLSDELFVINDSMEFIVKEENEQRATITDQYIVNSQSQSEDSINTSQLAINKQVINSDLKLKTGEEQADIQPERPSSNCYRVQVAAALKPITNQELRSIYSGPLTVMTYDDKGYYKYYIAEVSSYKQANELRLSSGVQDAFITKCPAVFSNNIIATAQPEIVEEIKAPEELTDTISSTEATAFVYKQKEKSLQESIEITDTLTEQPEIESSDRIASRDSIPESQDMDEPKSLIAVEDTVELADTEEELAANLMVEEPEDKVVLTDTSDTIAQASSLVVAKKHLSEETKKIRLLSDLSIHPDKESNLLYRLQVAAAIRPLKDDELKRIYNGPLTIKSFKENQYYKYYITQLPSYFLVREIQKDSELEQSYIVAYKSIDKLTIHDALIDQYRDRMQSKPINLTDSVIKVVTVYFDLDEFILPKDQLNSLQSVKQGLETHKTWYAIVDGHTDIQGADAYNFGLSEERALHVKKLLIQQGITAERIITNYYGESHLAQECSQPGTCSEEAHQANRRVEILLVQPEN